MTFPHRFQEPERVLPEIGEKIVSALSALGIDSSELFCAGGIDLDASGCQVRLSRFFKSQDQARQAATAMGRSKCVIARWRINASGSFKLVESSAS